MRGLDGEIILPGDFLPVAERRGMIRTIDRWVVREAIALLEQCRGEIRLQVNISGRSLSDPDFLDYTRSELSASSAAPSDLVFEVTETTAIANLEIARTFLTDLAAMGCGISLDDFGSGFASFQYLKSLPFDELKIDGQFIQNVTTNPDDLLLVETLVGLAHGLGKRTVAEYVENAATLRLIRDLGVDYAQGFFVGKPAPAETLIAQHPASGRATWSRP
jgi:EAL domain-containing protein (putative c-di-GMP-specific phosphodiesterase class I)